MNTTISLPDDVVTIIKQLNNAGFQAYAVGGCVRDSLLGIVPGDWDICTSALPEQTKACFQDYHVIETGLQHGTVTVRINHQSYEITTFRKDGEYKDCRRPEQVEFVTDIQDDLSRRDFTINAMAYHPSVGLIDCYGGKDDLNHCMIRCVGDAQTRFSEDALRIMRGLRFASVYGFSLESATEDAMYVKKDLLKNIASERIQIEFKKLLLGKGIEQILLKYRDIFSVFIPEFVPMFDFEQQNHHHQYDVWTHTIKSVGYAEPNDLVRLAVLFHDIGKPKNFFTDENGVGHFYSHAEQVEILCKTVLQRLKFDTKTINDVTQLVKYHDAQIQATEKSVKRWLNRLGTERFGLLLSVKRADAKATVYAEEKLQSIDFISSIFQEILEKQECYSLKDLAISGADCIANGIPEGKEVGLVLSEVLDLVIENSLKNEREALLSYIKNRKKSF